MSLAIEFEAAAVAAGRAYKEAEAESVMRFVN